MYSVVAQCKVNIVGYCKLSNYSTSKNNYFLETMYKKIDFIWWYIGVIKEGVLTEADAIIRKCTVQCT